MADTGKPVSKAATAPAVPTKDSTNNSYENEVVGNKTDSPVVLQSSVASAEGYLKGLAQRGNVFYCTADSGSTTSIVSAQMVGFGDSFFGNASGYGRWYAMVMKKAATPGAAPENEIQPISAYTSVTGTFTTGTFSSAIAVGDLILIIHLAGMYGNICAAGIFTTSSATVPADNVAARAGGKATKFYDGCILMPLTGSAALQQRRILRFTTSTGVFQVDPARPFTAATGTVPYVIIQGQDINLSALYFGTFTTSSVSVPADTTAGAAYGNDYFKGCTIMPLSGGAIFQPRIIKQFTATTGVFTLDEQFTVAPSTVAYVILPQQVPIQRLLDIFDQTNAILELKETGYSQLATDGTEQICYINNSPQGVFKPLNFIIDTTAMQAGDTLVVKEYYKIKSGGSFILKEPVYTYSDSQTAVGPLKVITLTPNRFGVEVTIQRTAGTDRAYDWEVFYENA